MSILLTLRPGEAVHFYKEWKGDIPPNVFAVSLINTPSAPGENHPEAWSLALICMGHYICSGGQRPGEKLWGWMSLVDKEDRELIADALLNADAELGYWYYIEIVQEEVDIGEKEACQDE